MYDPLTDPELNKLTEIVLKVRRYPHDTLAKVEFSETFKVGMIDRLLREIDRLKGAVGNFAADDSWHDAPGCLQWMGKRHAVDYAKAILAGEPGSL